MKSDSNDNRKVLDRNVYGDGTNFTKDGMRRYLYEKEAGLTHSYAQRQDKYRKKYVPTEESF